MENDVAATEAEPQAPFEESADVHEKSLDEILAGISGEPAQPALEPPAPAPSADNDLAAALKATNERLDAMDKRTEQANFETEMNSLVDFVRASDEAIGQAYDDEEIRALLEYQAVQKPNIGVAFGNQYSNPQAWNQVKAGLAAELAKKAAGKVSNSEERVAAQVSSRGVTTTPPPEQEVKPQTELADMAQNDPIAFRRYKESL
jgi:uncharacterized protein YajQ (UPF0234 family)